MAKTNFSISMLTQVKLIVLAIVVWNIITAWDDFIDNFLYDVLKFKRTTWNAFKIAIVVTVIGILVLHFSKVRAHTILGVDISNL